MISLWKLKQNRPKSITKYNPTTHNYKTNSDNKPNFDKLVEETKKAVKKQMILGKENCQKNTEKLKQNRQ